MSSSTDKIKGYANEAVGNIKQVIGKAVDSDKLKAEGKLQEIKGEAQKTVGAVKDAAHDAVDRASTSSTADTVKGYANEAAGKIKQRVGSATSNSDLEADGLAQEVQGDIQKLTGRAKRDAGA